jgi:hypothetical protein
MKVNELRDLVIIFTLYAAVIAAIWYYYRNIFKRERNRLRKLLSYFPGSYVPESSSVVPSGPSNEYLRRRCLNGNYQNLNFCIDLIPQTFRGTRPILTIFFQKSAKLRISVYEKAGLSRLAEKFYSPERIKTGDVEFDEMFSIAGNNQNLAVTYFSDNEVKRALSYLFSLGFSAFESDGQVVSVEKSPYDDVDLEQRQIVEAVHTLYTLADKLG